MKYLDLFSGCGGMSLGFVKNGYECVGAVDFWKPAGETYKENFPTHDFRLLDLFDEKNVKEVIQWQVKQSPDLIIGGPPCQGFSTLGSRKSSDKRNNLIKTYLKIVKNIGPKFFIMENVKAIGNTRYSSTKSYSEFIHEYALKDSLGHGKAYNVFNIVLNSLEFGAAQSRERSFFIGVRKDIVFNQDILKIEIAKNKKKPKVLADVIFDLPRLSAGQGEDRIIVGKKIIYNHKAMGHGAELVKRIECVPVGGGLLDVSDDLLTPHLKKMKEGKYGSGGHVKNIYGRLDWDKPSGTIIAGMDKITCGRYVHPEDHRLLTPRECARIQSFPDNFRFIGSQVSQYYLIGNAVPPVFSNALAKVLISYSCSVNLKANKGAIKKQELNL